MLPNFRHIFFFFLLTVAFTASAQYEDSLFIRYSVKDGLNSNYITSIQQDDLGYIWIGSDQGLNRFDGINFKNFSTDENPGLPSGNIFKLKQFGNGRLGIIGKTGLYVLNTTDLGFIHYYIPDSTFFTYYLNATWDAKELPDRSVAMSTATGFYVFEPGGKIRSRFDALGPNDQNQRILYGRDMLRFSGNDLIVYTHNNGLGYYDIQKKKYRELEPDDLNWNAFRIIPKQQNLTHHIPFPIGNDQYIFLYALSDSLAFYDHKSRHFTYSSTGLPLPKLFDWKSNVVALSDTLFAINSSLGGFYFFSMDPVTHRIRFNPHRYLAGHSINVLFVDQEHRLWAATNKGLLRQRIRENFLQTRYYPPVPGEIANQGYTSVFRYKDKQYISRYSRDQGLFVFDTATGKLIKALQFNGSDNGWNEISSMAMYHPDTLWLGADRGSLWLDLKTYHYGVLHDPSIYPEISIMFSPVNQHGDAWFVFYLEGTVGRYHVASRTFTYYSMHSKPALPFARVKSIVYDSYGDVWLSGHSLARWNSKTQMFDTLITEYGGANKFNNDILAISADQHGSLWMHNAENGLLEYRIREKKFISYTTKDGLPSMVLTALSPIVDDVLWISSPGKLTSFNIVTKKSFVYDVNDGVPDEPASSRRMYYDSSSRYFYLTCGDYVSRFPALTVAKPTHMGELLIQEIRINENKIINHPPDMLRLRYNENNINLQFNIIEFESTNGYQLSYKIDEDKNWTLSGLSRSIRMNGLAPGKHTIQLRAVGKNGGEKMKQFSFIIKKPFWKTNLFIAAIALLLLGAAIFFYRRRLNSIHQKANIDKLIAQTQMKALHAQMNPHFVFNSLNSIREMVLNNETKEASHFLSKFAQLMRMTLEHSAHNFISLRSTMEYLQRYMEMEQIRNDRFTCRILADEELDPDETLLPPMLIQPFIENAIWHGIAGDRRNININIDFKSSGNQLVCIIDDDGIGINQSKQNKSMHESHHTSVGIANIKERIRLLNEKYGLESDVEIVDKSSIAGAGHGTRVTIRLPLEIE